MCHMDPLLATLDAVDTGTMAMNFMVLDVGSMDLDLDTMVP